MSQTEKIQSSIHNVKEAGLEGGMGSLIAKWEKDLQILTAERHRLQQLNPDEPFALPPSLPPFSSSFTKEGRPKEEGLRRQFRKRLVFSRLPPLLCLHLGRRVFSPSLQKMLKVKEKVIFPLLMDMTGFAAYGGGMSADVALQQPMKRAGEMEVGKGGTRWRGAAMVRWQAEGKGEGGEEEREEGRREERLSNGNGIHYCNEYKLSLSAPIMAPSSSSSSSSIFTISPHSSLPSSSPSSFSSSLCYKYLLQAVIVHHGSADSGHYTAYRRLSPSPSPSTLLQTPSAEEERGGGRAGGNQDSLKVESNVWVHISDDAVAPATEEEVLESEAYLLFYQSLDSIEEKEEEEEEKEEKEEIVA